MTEESHFLEAIQANPEDLAMRLVYADWLEERGDARSEYLRADAELQKLIGMLSGLGVEAKVRNLRARLKRLAKPLDAAWVATLETLRPELFRCKVCRKFITADQAIDTSPRNYQKMKNTRYCRLCYEDAVRMQMHQAFNSSLSAENYRANDYSRESEEE